MNPTFTGAIVGSIAGILGGFVIGRAVIGEDTAKFRKSRAIPTSWTTGEVQDEMTADKLAVIGVTLIVGGLIGAAVVGPTSTPPQVAVK